MIRLNRFTIPALLMCTLTACGGGGGGGSGIGIGTGSSAAPAPAPASPPPSAGGGGSSPIVNSPANGLGPGGVGITTDTGRLGVQLDVAVGGTGAWMGSIQGFSSIILNDNIVTTTNARFFVEGAAGQQTDLRQGQQILIVGETQTGTATEVHYRANVKGPMTAITITNAADGITTLTVMGQRVFTNATTIFTNTRIDLLVAGDLLEVSGNLDTDGNLIATYVERKSQLIEYKAIGIVASLASSTFFIGGLTVNFSGANIRDFPNNNLVSSDVVEVKGAPSDFTAPSSLRATTVQRLPQLVLGSDAQLRLEGLITRFVSPSNFEIQGSPITTNNTTQYVNGDSASLALGVKAQIEGQGNGSGSILATKVTIQRTNTARAEGDITSINTTTRAISLLGVTYSVRDLTQIEDESSARINPMSFADFNVGDEVEIRGYLDGSTLVATRIERDDDRNRARLRGPVTALNSAARALSILNVPLTVNTTTTQYRDLSDAPISQANFFNLVSTQSYVRATWDNFNATRDVVDELSLED